METKDVLLIVIEKSKFIKHKMRNRLTDTKEKNFI